VSSSTATRGLLRLAGARRDNSETSNRLISQRQGNREGWPLRRRGRRFRAAYTHSGSGLERSREVANRFIESRRGAICTG
jgi:hypothetical protein